ncbi:MULTISPECIES: 3-oxoadipate enol-lactonase [unclassified Dietzia]|uniref:3-oxoadipate enol-lactonase n=1 Tax=unclassified Dietzia TaxID=2617939 RepID=UPI000D20E36F|nr:MULTISPECIES: 3-oxoadipate enol-lactonase [unclassified Dietzia]AVZ39015.1 3-oxoadipate enol-lactonase [Dietzia sp. JS16-p6b]QGW24184.1 3-oxoadipate enol-lactone hydrolase/4-carboxymuconolactone decarboxylase [Dietzia sp. DQ12-45-1b]
MPATLSCQVSGPRPENAPVVVLLGSLGSDRSMWNAQVRDLARDHTVIAVDHRGHGGSDVIPGPCTIADLAGDVLALLDTLGVDRFHVVGLSLGGALAQWLAVHEPTRVGSAALLCTAARFGKPSAWVERAAAVRDGGTGAVADAVVARWITPRRARQDPALVDSVREMILATSAEGYAAACDALSGWDGRADLGRITCPTLVIAGDEDPSTPPDVVRELAAGIPGAEFLTLSPAAHVPTVEIPDRVTAVLRSHLSTHATA